MKINEEDGFWCDVCGNGSLKLIEFELGPTLCEQCLERALAMVKGEDDVRG